MVLKTLVLAGLPHLTTTKNSKKNHMFKKRQYCHTSAVYMFWCHTRPGRHCGTLGLFLGPGNFLCGVLLQKFLRLSEDAQVRVMETVGEGGRGGNVSWVCNPPPDCCDSGSRNHRHPEGVTEAVKGSRWMEQPIRIVRSPLSSTIPHQTVCVLRQSWWRAGGRSAPRHSVAN